MPPDRVLGDTPGLELLEEVPDEGRDWPRRQSMAVNYVTMSPMELNLDKGPLLPYGGRYFALQRGEGLRSDGTQLDTMGLPERASPSDVRRKEAGSLYTGKLVHTGALATESFSILESYSHLSQDWPRVRRAVLERNLLGKKSTVRAEKIAEAVRRRFLLAPPWLPPASYVTWLGRLTRSDRVKQNIVLVYLTAEDALFHDVLFDLFVGRRPGSLAPAHWEVIQTVRRLRSSARGLSAWSSSMERRWAEGFFAVSRQLGLLNGGPPPMLRPPAVRGEAFAFFFIWLYHHLGSAKAAVRHSALDPYFLSPEPLHALLEEGRQKGWWGYAASEGLFEMSPAPQPLEEWLRGLETR